METKSKSYDKCRKLIETIWDSSRLGMWKVNNVRYNTIIRGQTTYSAVFPICPDHIFLQCEIYINDLNSHVKIGTIHSLLSPQAYPYLISHTNATSKFTFLSGMGSL